MKPYTFSSSNCIISISSWKFITSFFKYIFSLFCMTRTRSANEKKEIYLFLYNDYIVRFTFTFYLLSINSDCWYFWFLYGTSLLSLDRSLYSQKSSIEPNTCDAGDQHPSRIVMRYQFHSQCSWSGMVNYLVVYAEEVVK